MGWVGKAHKHDYPSADALRASDAGKVWECSCRERFLYDALGIWIREDPKIKFVLEEDLNVSAEV